MGTEQKNDIPRETQEWKMPNLEEVAKRDRDIEKIVASCKKLKSGNVFEQHRYKDFVKVMRDFAIDPDFGKNEEKMNERSEEEPEYKDEVKEGYLTGGYKQEDFEKILKYLGEDISDLPDRRKLRIEGKDTPPSESEIMDELNEYFGEVREYAIDNIGVELKKIAEMEEGKEIINELTMFARGEIDQPKKAENFFSFPEFKAEEVDRILASLDIDTSGFAAERTKNRETNWEQKAEEYITSLDINDAKTIEDFALKCKKNNALWEATRTYLLPVFNEDDQAFDKNNQLINDEEIRRREKLYLKLVLSTHLY